MTKASSAEPTPPQSVGSLIDYQAPGGRGRSRWVWGGVLFGFACLFVAYFFAFRASHAAQIKDVPLATKGGRP